MTAEPQELPKNSPQKPEDHKEEKQEAPISVGDIHPELTVEQVKIASNLLQEITLLYPGKNGKIDVAKLEAILKTASSVLPGDLGSMYHVLPLFYSKFGDIVHCACKNGQAAVIRLLRNANFQLDKIVVGLPQAVSDAIEHKHYAVIYALADSVDWNRIDEAGNIWLNKANRDRKMVYLLASLGARDDDLLSGYHFRVVRRAYEIGKKEFDKRNIAIKQAPGKPAEASPLKKLDDRKEQKRRVLAIPSNRRPWEPTAEQEVLIFEFLGKLKLAKQCVGLPELLKRILVEARVALSRDLGKMYELTPLSAITDEDVYSLLRAASNQGCVDIIDLLKDAGFELDKADLNIHTIIWEAAFMGHCNVVRALADLNNIDWNTKSDVLGGYGLLCGVEDPEMHRLLASLGVENDKEMADLRAENPQRFARLGKAYAEGKKEFEEKRAALPREKAFLIQALSPWLIPALYTMVLKYMSKDFILEPVKSKPPPEPGESRSFGM